MTSALHDTILQAKRIQREDDFSKSVDKLETLAKCVSVVDILKSDKIPFPIDERDNYIHTSPLSSAKKLNSIIDSPVVQLFLNKYASTLNLERDPTMYLTKAFEALHTVKTCSDKNFSYFKAALYFAELTKYDPSIIA